MTAKQMKFLQLFSEIAKLHVLEPDALLKRFKSLLALDFGYGVDVWEYMTTLYESDLSRNVALSEFFGNTLLDLFAERAEQKTIFVVRDIAAIRRFVLQYNPKANVGLSHRIVCDAVTGGKYAFAEELLRGMSKNQHIDFGDYLKAIIEMVIVELLKKSNASGGKVVMPRKLSALLLTFTAKLKAAQRILLEQRIKEVC